MARDYGRVHTAAPSFEASGLKYRARYNRRVAVWNKTGGACWHCEAYLAFAGADAFHMDHLQAKARGGSNSIFNLVPACPHCNASKWHRESWDVSMRGPKKPTRWERQMEKDRRLRGVEDAYHS